MSREKLQCFGNKRTAFGVKTGEYRSLFSSAGDGTGPDMKKKSKNYSTSFKAEGRLDSQSDCNYRAALDI
jgi:hypothetical protein